MGWTKEQKEELNKIPTDKRAITEFNLQRLKRLVLNEKNAIPTWEEEELQIGRFGHQQFARRKVKKSLDPDILERARKKAITSLCMSFIDPPAHGMKLMQEIMAQAAKKEELSQPK